MDFTNSLELHVHMYKRNVRKEEKSLCDSESRTKSICLPNNRIRIYT